jgi:hypothetical protein
MATFINKDKCDKGSPNDMIVFSERGIAVDKGYTSKHKIKDFLNRRPSALISKAL